nr:GDSL esterase/lipase At1g28610-like isoform X2 [Coffea arabica]
MIPNSFPKKKGWKAKSKAEGCYTSIFAFGDSLTDNGNLLALSAPRIIHQGRLPNGETYFHHPTGRCCDGRLIVDFLAQQFGLPIPPPYTEVSKERTMDVRAGVNFAVAGARALDTDFYDKIGIIDPVTNDTLRVQLDWFKHMLPSICGPEKDCGGQLKSSLVLLGPFGGNDYRYALFQGASLAERKLLAHLITDAAVSAVNELVELGVGAVMVPGLVPDGCLAVSLTYFGSPNTGNYDLSTGCINWLNEFAEYHNELLQTKLNMARKRHPTAAIIYADYYNAILQLYRNPEEYGFRRTTAACCGDGGPYNYNKEVQCGDPPTTVCPDPSVYINWDGPHFTEAANRWITSALLRGPGRYTLPHLDTSCISEAASARHFTDA